MSEGDNRQFGWDTSHYDGVITVEEARAAKAEGIVFATAKIGEGRGYDDPLDSTNLANLRDGGIEFLGGYHVVRTDDVEAQLSNLLRLADRDEPWWRDWPVWCWQVDLERWPYDSVPAAIGIEFAKRLRDRTSRQVLLYASRGQYGDQLTAWDGPLWNAHYPSDAWAPFLDLYPGDDFRGWNPYSGKAPAILQYASTGIIAGMTTCDVNAFRGTYSQLRALLTQGDEMELTDQVPLPAEYFPEIAGQKSVSVGELLAWTSARVRRQEVQMAELMAKVGAIAEKVDITPDELALVTEAAMAGAAAGVAGLRAEIDADTKDTVTDALTGGVAAVQADGS